MRSCAQFTVLRLLLAAMLLASLPLAAQGQTASQKQPSPQEQVFDENFVIASLLISDPGGALYSRLGHAALHMQCPEHNLDYVFSYTSENIFEKPFSFLSGKLRMGLVAVSPDEYLKGYADEGRGVREYTLNLPIEVKRNLWRILDNHMMEGMDLEFDYIRRGCAHSTLMLLKESLNATRPADNPSALRIEYGKWPDYFEKASRREITYEHLKEHKWTTFLLHFICNGIIDNTGCSNEQKTIIPADLPFILSNATVDGVPMIDSEPREILPNTWQPEGGWFTPTVAALVLLALTIICAIFHISAMDYVLLTIQTLLGLAAVWLLLFSSLCCTEWSWLIIPFNPLPLIFWKWRRKWALPYAIILLIWCAFMFLWPHLLTDPAYVVVALSLSICCFVQYLKFSQTSVRL